MDAVVITAGCHLIENKWDILPQRVQFEKTLIEPFKILSRRRNLSWLEHENNMKCIGKLDINGVCVAKSAIVAKP